MKKKVLVLFGGVSSEHEVSLNSAKSVIDNIPRDRYDVLPMGITSDGSFYLYSGDIADLPEDKWLADPSKLESAVISCDRAHHGIIHTATGEVERVDAVFPVLHGMNGEDGTIQGLLTIAGIPFVGCNTEASAMCMDKAVTNALADFYGIPQAKWTAFDRHAYAADKALLLKTAADKLGFPIFVKPANTGSSVGVTKVCSFDELAPACEKAFEFDKKIVLEEGIDGVEIECAVLGNEEPTATFAGEIAPSQEFYTFEAKYVDGTSGLYIPAHISEKAMQTVREDAVRVYRALGCKGLSRVDFFCTYAEDEIVFNEINTIPGFTNISMYPKLQEHMGLAYADLIDKLIGFAMERYDG